jgi:hypothetical protein
VAKSLAAAQLTEETRMATSEPSRGATLVPVARIGSPLLLKTNLPPFTRHPVSGKRVNLLSV